jgi:hypothetical protein
LKTFEQYCEYRRIKWCYSCHSADRTVVGCLLRRDQHPRSRQIRHSASHLLMNTLLANAEVPGLFEGDERARS